MQVLIAGGSGTIGEAITHSLVSDGCSVMILTRNPARVKETDKITAIRWDGKTADGWKDVIERTDAILNLVGENLSTWPWTETQKRRFLESRIHAGKAILAAVSSARRRPKVLIQASGINHYGIKGAVADETSPPGDDFLAKLTLAWEDSTRGVEELGVRRVVTRLAVVLAKGSGLLPLMSLPVRLFLGGKLGTGRQAVPWVHIQDVVHALQFFLDNGQTQGAYNLIAPTQVSNADFYRLLAQTLKRPYWLPVPSFLLKLALGEMATLVVDGRYAVPRRLMDAGYKFSFENAAAALADLLG
ncbi:MAG: TIGR01777 family oxidoreductase [Chloroflexota bacterium]